MKLSYNRKFARNVLYLAFGLICLTVSVNLINSIIKNIKNGSMAAVFETFLLLFAPFTVILLWRVVRIFVYPAVIADEKGIRCRYLLKRWIPMANQTIPWEDIKDISASTSVGGTSSPVIIGGNAGRKGGLNSSYDQFIIQIRLKSNKLLKFRFIEIDRDNSLEFYKFLKREHSDIFR